MPENALEPSPLRDRCSRGPLPTLPWVWNSVEPPSRSRPRAPAAWSASLPPDHDPQLPPPAWPLREPAQFIAGVRERPRATTTPPMSHQPPHGPLDDARTHEDAPTRSGPPRAPPGPEGHKEKHPPRPQCPPTSTSASQGRSDDARVPVVLEHAEPGQTYHQRRGGTRESVTDHGAAAKRA